MRTCVIDMPGLNGRLLDRLDAEAAPAWLRRLLNRGRSVIRPVLPAVTMPVQATYTTGKRPEEHGIVANGFAAYRLPEIHKYLDLSNFPDYRCHVSFWEQSNELLSAPRIWRADGRSAALLFVQSSMGGAADIVVTPKPEHTPDGRTIPDCWTDPPDLHERLKQQLGPFPLHRFWGPMSGIEGSEWIIAAGRLVWEWHPTDLMWLYVPQLDYDVQRYGPGDERNVASLRDVLGLLTPLVERVEADGGRPLLLSEYGMTAVGRSTALNVHLRRAGLLRVNDGGEVDYEGSKSFAMCDHQVAHVYCTDETAAGEARALLEDMPEVAAMYHGRERAEVHLDTGRAGDIIAFAHGDAWFEYRWWEDFAEAPNYAWRIDIHRKPGYDPLEMWADPQTRRIRADEPHLVRGSHGAPVEEEADRPLLIGCEAAAERIDATDVAGLI